MTKQEILARLARGAHIKSRTVWAGDVATASYTLDRDHVSAEQIHELMTGRYIASVIVEPDVLYRITQSGRLRARVRLVVSA